ncbi:MAG: hypothetical protein ABFS19_04760 [Thermodesulfobacteriota bacterium]
MALRTVPRQRFHIINCVGLLCILLVWSPEVNAAPELEPLQLSLSPSIPAGGEVCAMHPEPGTPPARQSRPVGRPGAAAKSGKSEKPARSGRPGGVHESEHRPVPKRAYHFNDYRRRADVETFVRRPDGSVITPDVHLGYNPGLSFPTPMGNGPVHGANSVYVVEQGVDGDTLQVRTAKWITMHHNCGWGHDSKFDKTRTQPQPLASIPFEIIVSDLWDTNFHAAVKSGDRLKITVLSYGTPVAGARVTLTSEKGWSKEVMTNEQGVATLQLIRDYYPVSWDRFRRTHRGKFLVTARHNFKRSGSYREQPYQRVSYLTTLPWKYSPSQQDYASYRYGLLVALLTMTVSGLGVYSYRDRRSKPYKRISLDE